MKKTAYTIPTESITHESNKDIVAKAIESLNADYLVNSEFMETDKRLAHLELIANLTHIYFNMTLAFVKEWKTEKRIIEAYKENHTELLKMQSHGEIEEEYYCKGYEEALNFVISLLNINI